MKTRNLIILVLIPLQTLQTFGNNNEFKNRIRFSASPAGINVYQDDYYGVSYSYFNALSLSYEFIPFRKFGFEAFFNLNGYRYSGYETDYNDNFSLLYGVPELTAGIGAVFHPYGLNKKIDLALAWGLGYSRSLVTADDYRFPDIVVRLGLGYKVNKNLRLGIELCGLAYLSDFASEDTYSYTFMSLNLGINASFYF